MNSRGPDDDVKSVRGLRSNFKWNGRAEPIGKMYGINIGCLESVSEKELSEIPITYVDGLHDRWASGPEFSKHL